MNGRVKRNRMSGKTINDSNNSKTLLIELSSAEDEDQMTTTVMPQHFNVVPQRKSIKLIEETMVDPSILHVIPPKEGDYSVGDLIWSKVHGYPWWPCMVSVDPTIGIYAKISGTSYKADRVYHVQYFGPEALRGWTFVGMVMPFNGRDKYFEKIKTLKESSPKSQMSKINAKYAVKPSQRKKWDQSVAEAEEAMKLDSDVRVKTLTFQYSLTSKASNKRSSDSAIFDVEAKRKKMTSSPEDIYDFDEDMEEIDVDVTKSSTGLMWRKRAQKGDFAQYVKNHFKTVKKENPKSSKQELNDMLKRRWDLLGEDLRSLYIPPHSKSHSDQTQDTTPKTPSAKSLNADSATKSRSKSNSRKSKSKQNIIAEEKLDQNDKSDESDGELVINESPVNVTPKKSVRPKIKKNLDFPANDISVNGRKSHVSPKKESISSSTDLNVSSTSTKKSRKSTAKSNPQPPPQPTIDKKLEENGKIADNTKPAVVHTSEQTLMTLGIDFSDEFASSEDASSTSEPEVNDSAKPTTDQFCALCNDDDVETLVSCDGQCLQMFHKKCVKYNGNDNQFKCNECKTGEHPCFLCKKLEGVATHKCSDMKCGKFYHISCLEKKNYPIKINGSKDNFLCPLHFCLNCHIESQNDKDFRPSRRRLVKCISCPTAYHLGDYCIAAGTVQVSQNYVICPDHYESVKKKKKDKHLNVNYCFSCLTGGQLVCCESCPAAFHDQCLDYTLDPDSNFYCTDCTLRKQLRYGDIVWVKLGFYRWWPGKVCHPKAVPDNVMKLAHVVGEFPVYFFGSHDYYWLHKGRVFLFMEGDNKVVTASNGGKKNSKSLMKTFKLAMEEAAEAFQLWNNSKVALRRAMLINKPPPYTHIRSNKPVGKVQIVNANESQINLCECNIKSENPCSDENCLNRALMVECDPKICRAEDKCKNQRFKKREYVLSKPFKTESAGWGLRSLQDISKGQFVIEYVGELIDEEECELRLKTMAKNEQSNFYFLTIDKDKIIDAGPKGNLARFMNHSCQPNCETQKWMVNGATRVGLFAVTDIPTGTELTFNYNLDCRGNEKSKCVCGSSNCSGFIGVRPNKSEENGTKKAINGANQKKKKKKVEKKDFEKMHDDECFTCGEGGDLIMCDRKGCPKSYHMECLKLEQIPKGKWECPRHFCDNEGCGKSATAMCSFCPNSLCKEHAIPSKLTQLPDGGLLCSDHANEDVNGVLLEPEVSALNDSGAESARKEPVDDIDTNIVDDNILNNSSNSLILNSTVESAVSDDSKQCETNANVTETEKDSNELSVTETTQSTIN